MRNFRSAAINEIKRSAGKSIDGDTSTDFVTDKKRTQQISFEFWQLRDAMRGLTVAVSSTSDLSFHLSTTPGRDNISLAC